LGPEQTAAGDRDAVVVGCVARGALLVQADGAAEAGSPHEHLRAPAVVRPPGLAPGDPRAGGPGRPGLARAAEGPPRPRRPWGGRGTSGGGRERPTTGGDDGRRVPSPSGRWKLDPQHRTPPLRTSAQLVEPPTLRESADVPRLETPAAIVLPDPRPLETASPQH